MGDVDSRHAELSLDPRDLRPHLDTESGVEIRERLVHEEGLGFSHDRASHRDALPLPTRKLARLSFEVVAQTENCGCLLMRVRRSAFGTWRMRRPKPMLS